MDENKNLIVEKTTNIGKTDEQKVYEILKRQQEQEEKQSQEEHRAMEKERKQEEMILLSACTETVSKALVELKERVKECMEPLAEALGKICRITAAEYADYMKSVKKILEAIREKLEEYRIEKERRIGYLKCCITEGSEKKGKIRKQERKAFKFSKYELRVYKNHYQERKNK